MSEKDSVLRSISTEIEKFQADSAAAVGGNKAAAARSRKSSLVLTKLFKTWRKVSMQ